VEQGIDVGVELGAGNETNIDILVAFEAAVAKEQKPGILQVGFVVEPLYMLPVSSVDIAVLVEEVVVHTQLPIVGLDSKHKPPVLVRSSLLVVDIVDRGVGVVVPLGCRRENLSSRTLLPVLEFGTGELGFVVAMRSLEVVD